MNWKLVFPQKIVEIILFALKCEKCSPIIPVLSYDLRKPGLYRSSCSDCGPVELRKMA